SIARYGLGDGAGAADDLDLAVAQAPDDPSPLADRAEACLLDGRIDAAERDIAAVAALAPDSAAALGSAALLDLARGDFESARRGFERAAAADPSGNWTLRFGLACLLGGHRDEAVAAYARGIASLCAGDARMARMELDHWLAGATVDAAGVEAVRAQLDAALRPAAPIPRTE
ncbi:MAG TPA: hypothetical protein PLG77_06475, partial [Burkholderiaceae bacterium]|nr:hypothetical protein [Burkholderiaceae bacterium]